ncbi:hypothetical protein CP880_08190 [Cutibacterium namnetense]|uniref:Uncharacterized protein n=1 Tax=Cutibacterium namnetense TaxID=1574624 RepID=A0ABX9I9C0_9ACTN|nr:hypothetical protein CP880_08190 [Cutibacterium namnetense]
MHRVNVRLPRIGLGPRHSTVSEVGASPTLSRNGDATRLSPVDLLRRGSDDFRRRGPPSTNVCWSCGMTAGRTA